MVVALCAALVLLVGMIRSRAGIAPAKMAAYLPEVPGLTLGIDVGALRRGGILEALGGPGITAEPEYKQFVQESGFNWEADLDYILARLTSREKYFLLKGRFDWSALRGYTIRHGGACRNAFCEMEGSSPDRVISFFPLRVDVMALAVGPERGLAWSLAERGPGLNPAPPDSPIWLRFRPGALREAAASEPLRELLAVTEGAEEIQLELAGHSEGYFALLEAECRSGDDAASLATRLTAAARVLGALSGTDGSGEGDATVGRVLARGLFEARGPKVFGRWPIEKGFVEGILGVSR